MVLRIMLIAFILSITNYAQITYKLNSTGSQIDEAVNNSFKKFNTVLYVSNDYTTNASINEYKTIASALANYDSGDVIILAPEYFDEDVTINIDNVHIQGLNKELSKIKSLTVTGGYARLENFTVNGTATFTSQKANTGVWGKLKTILNDINFSGSLNVGTSSVRMTEQIEMHDCSLLGYNTFTFNNSGSTRISGFSMYSIDSDIDLRGNIKIYEGELRFINAKIFYIDSLCYMTSDKWSLIAFSGAYQLAIYKLHNVTSTAFHMLIFHESRGELGTSTGTDFVFDGLFELDIINSSIGMWKNLIFNSTANSRLMGWHQRGYQSTTQISGTGLNKLRIYNCTLSGTAPEGLADERGNVWSAFMDN